MLSATDAAGDSVPEGRSPTSPEAQPLAPSAAPALRPRIFLSAGEASGEHDGALLMEAIRRRAPGAVFFGLGGPRMAEHGLDQIVRAEDVAHMGITEILRHAPFIYGQYRKLKRSLAGIPAGDEHPAAEGPPDLAILIDFPDVNLRLAEELQGLGVPVVFFVSPQLWAWKKRRILRVQKYVTRMLVIFPFEEPFYRARGVPAEFVGHPLADLPLPDVSREDFAQRYELDADKPWIALLPGSRLREIALNLPTLVAAAAALGPGYEYVLPIAHTLPAGQVAALLARARPAVPIHLTRNARASLLHARASVVASGTATVEAALIGNPFVVVYRLSALSYAIARRFIDLPHVAMPNLIAGRRIVPELIQSDFNPLKIVQALGPLLDDTPERRHMLESLAEVRSLLHVGNNVLRQESAIDRVARISLSLIHGLAASPANVASEPRP